MKMTPSASGASWPKQRILGRPHRPVAHLASGAVLDRRVDVVIESTPRCFGLQVSLCYAAVMLFLVTFCVRADQVKMQNGDHYLGTVLSLDTNTLVLRSTVLGTVNLPRDQVALITLGSDGATNSLRAVSAAKRQSTASSLPLTNGVNDLSAPLRQLGANTNFIEQVRAQFLADAGPEANNKFNAMVGGLLSGRLTVNDIRAEAKSAADQLNELKRGLGEETGWALDGYLAILENFLRETAPPRGVSATNDSRPSPKAEREPVRKEE